MACQPLHSFVSEYLSEQPLERLRSGVDGALAFMSDVAQLSVYPALLQLVAAVNELLAMARWPQRYAACGLEVRSL